MSSADTSDRVNTLLTQVDEAVKNNNLQKASEVLREASHLDAQNARVKQRWTVVQKQSESAGDTLDLLRNYLGSHDEVEGEKALQALKKKQLSTSDAERAVELLLHSTTTTSDLVDTLAGSLLSNNIAARRWVATKLSDNATETFELIFLLGASSFTYLASVPLEDALWTSNDQQVVAQKDFFRLCAAKLIDAGADHLERVVKCIAKFLSVVPTTVSDIVDADVLDAVLASLDIRLLAPLRSQAMLATSKFLEATGQSGEELFSAFIKEKAGKATNDDLIIAFSAAAAMFPVIPAVAGRLFLIDGFVQQLVPNLERNWEDGEKEGGM